MLRVSKLTDYATVVMAAMAEQPQDLHAASGLAERTRLELPTVSKLLKQLAASGLIESRRGVNGGYRLVRAPDQISVLEIYEAMEGKLAMTDCADHQGACNRESHCQVRQQWRSISGVIARAMAEVSLADLNPPTSFVARGKAVPIKVALASGAAS